MLSTLRKNAGSWAIKFILGFIALTFVSWGAYTYHEREQEVAATVGSTRITLANLGEAVAGLEKSYRDVYGSAFTPEMEKALDLKRQALDGLIQRTLLLAEANRMGITARKAEVQREIAAIPAFQVDGQFREDRYRSVLAYNRVSPTEYEAAKRDEITIRKMEGLLTASSRVSPGEAREMFDLSFRKIRLVVVESDPAAMRSVPAPTPEEIDANYAETKERYRIPARVKLEVAAFSPDRFAKNAPVTEEEIRSYYEGNPARFRTEESRLLSHILLPYTGKTREAVRKRAEELRSKAGESREAFDALAKSTPGGSASPAWFTRADLRPQVADAAFSVGVDSVAGPVDTGNGFMILRVHRIRFPETLPLEKVRDRVVSLLRHEKGTDLAVVKAYEAHGKATETMDLAGACASYGIPLADSGWVTGDRPGSLPSPVVQEALLLRTGEIGPVKTVGDTHYLFRVTAKEESRIPELPAVRERVRQAVLERKREARARSLIEGVLAGARSREELERKARKEGLRVRTTPFFLPLSGPLPEPLAEAGEIRKEMLSLSWGHPVSPKVLPAGKRFLAIAFLDEQPPGEAEWKARRESFTRELAERKKAEVIAAFLAERRKTARVEINPRALQ
ncbi:MAG: peptidyl-prolyl cis-trans isomerase [Deltaproteobacteria bacterium]